MAEYYLSGVSDSCVIKDSVAICLGRDHSILKQLLLQRGKASLTVVRYDSLANQDTILQ